MQILIRRRSATVWTAAWCGAVVIATVGCGTSQYEAKMDSRLSELKQEAPFETLYRQGELLPGTGVQIRPPAVFKDQPYTEESKHQQDPLRKIDPRRVQPPFLKLPGFRLCHEAFETDENGWKMPYYLYLAASTEPAAGLSERLLAGLKREFPKTPVEWQTVEASTPQGKGTIKWKKVRVSGDKFFDRERSGDIGEFKKFPGTFELWLHEGTDYSVLVAWRVPEALSRKVSIDRMAPLVAGTLVLGPPPPPPAPAEKPAK